MSTRLFGLYGVVATGLLLAVAAEARAEDAARRTVSLDGVWEIGEGRMDAPPSAFGHRVRVPGLIDMAEPAFAEVGVKSTRREAFWYRRSFTVEGPIPAVATVKVHKAMFGTRVTLNGRPLGEHLPSFTPGLFDAHDALRVGRNELLVRVGAFRDALPWPIPSGGDFEKKKFIPGIFDSVELILSGTPHVARVQAVPDVAKKAVTIHAWLDHADAAVPVQVTIREAAGGRVVGEGRFTAATAGSERTGSVTIPMGDCRLWTPEDPFLYQAEVRTSADVLAARFGMRSFRLDPQTGRAILNGRPYFLRGSNVTLYRFFEDSQRGDKPWREEWVRRLHKAFRSMHWNSLRYCIGFPPELWYRVADEEGFLIQDEFPIWEPAPKPGQLDAAELAQEYTEWMQERWNHPCLAVWDACNETLSPETGKAIRKVRGLDFSNRPWDNGYSEGVDRADVRELHPYHFSNPGYCLSQIAADKGTLGWTPGHNPIIVNEYGWLWLNRDGTPTMLTRRQYENLLGPHSTTAQRRHLYARYMAAESEFWRSHRACAAVMHFCGLGYSRPDGQTSDHWTDVEWLTVDPEFFRYVGDAFAPVGLMIDAWADEYPPGKPNEFPVAVINDTYDPWHGSVRLRLVREARVLAESTRECRVPALGKAEATFTVAVPAEAGDYQLEAMLVGAGGQEVRSRRDFSVLDEAGRRARYGLAVGKPVQASSNLVLSGATSPAAVTDGRHDTRWSSEFSDPQWIAVDLGRPERISRVVLDWEAAYAKAYSIEISPDGQTWKEVYRTASGRGGRETVRFAAAEARWVRMTGIRRATNFGYSLWEIGVFPE